MTVLKFPLGELQTNCYFLIHGNECLIIDPADSADFILEEVQRRHLNVVGVLATHGHFDHILAAGEVQISLEALSQSRLPLYIHDGDMFLVKRLKETARHFLKHQIEVLPIQHFAVLKQGKMQLGSFSVEVLHTPGHTPGSCSFYFSTDSVIFTGDTLFKDAVGDFSHKYSNKKQLYESVKRILTVDENALIYPGHGEETLVQSEMILY